MYYLHATVRGITYLRFEHTQNDAQAMYLEMCKHFKNDNVIPTVVEQKAA